MLPELTSALAGVAVAFLGAATLVIAALGAYYAGLLKDRRQLAAKQHELAMMEIDERARAIRRQAAADAAAIAQETSYGRDEPLSGNAKAQLAADKLRELVPDLAQADRSTVADLVKIGASHLRTQSQGSLPAVSLGAYMVTPSQAPPADVVRPNAPEDRPTLPPLKRPLLPKGGTRT